MTHPRRQQLIRSIRAATRAALGVVALAAALSAAAAGDRALGLVFVLGAGVLALAARHELRRAECNRIGAKSEAAVRCVLGRLEREGWRVRHGVAWRGGGDLDHVLRAPSGVGFVIETKTRRYSAAHVERTRRAARWLARRRRRYPGGVQAVICITRARGLERVEAGVLFVSLNRLVPALRRVAESCAETTGASVGAAV